MEILNRSSWMSSARCSLADPRSVFGRRTAWIANAICVLSLTIVAIVANLSLVPSASAQTADPVIAESAGDEAPAAAQPAVPPLADKQSQVTERYRKLEELLLRLADVEAEENPERAALLRRAARQSRDTFVLEKLVAAGDSLKAEQFAKAIESQGAAKEGLDKLLTLLLSEDRPQRIRDEKKRIANMIKELKVVERLQRSTRARTENGAELKDVSGEQSQISKRSEKVRSEMKDDSEKDKPSEDTPSEDTPSEKDKDEEDKDGEEEDKEGKPSEDGKPNEEQEKPADSPDTKSPEAEAGEQPSEEMKSGEQKPGEQKPGEQKPGEQKPGEQKPGEQKPGEQKPGEQKPGEQKPGEQKPGEQKPGEQKPGEQKPGEQGESPEPQPESQPQTPQSPEQQAQSQLEEAIKEMKEAEKQLDDAKRNEAVEKQRQAEQNLREAIDRLEKILRQLREEEMQRELARLESRLRKMAQMQGKVLDDTKSLAAIPESQRDRQVELRAGNLAFEEKKIVLEADRAMLLLREEGSSVAFPEVMAQMRSDMQRIAERLAATKVDAVTMGIQEDVLAALEEMIAALQQAQRDLEKKKQEAQEGGQQQQGGEQGEQPLVEQIAELKLIRTMETRIKSTTERYSEMIGQEPADSTDVIPLIKDLSQRQSKLYRVTRDLVLKRNQ